MLKCTRSIPRFRCPNRNGWSISSAGTKNEALTCAPDEMEGSPPAIKFSFHPSFVTLLRRFCSKKKSPAHGEVIRLVEKLLFEILRRENTHGQCRKFAFRQIFRAVFRHCMNSAAVADNASMSHDAVPTVLLFTICGIISHRNCGFNLFEANL